MATSDPLMPASESGKTPQIYKLDDGKTESRYSKDVEAVRIQPPPQFIGLTKEQLEEYRNDSFWKPFRTVLFILFWLAWLAMFAGAIVLVVLSPKCAAKQKREWWEKKVSYQAWTPSFQDSNGDGTGDLRGMIERLDKLRKIGVQTLWPTPILSSDHFNYGVVNFEEVDPKLGTLDDFKQLIADVHDKEMFLIMDLPIATTSLEHPWFIASSQDTLGFEDFYHWSSAPALPSAFWSKGGVKGQSYMHYERKKHWPILNWGNGHVIEHIKKAAQFWLDLGVDGFNLGFVEYLARNGDAAQTNWEESVKRLATLVDAITDHQNASTELKEKSIALFTSLRDSNGTYDHKLSVVNDAGLHYVVNHELTALDTNCGRSTDTVGVCLHRDLKELLFRLDEQPMSSMWELGNPYVSRLTTRLGDRRAAELTMFVQLLLPGAVNFYYGDEIGMLDAAVADDEQQPHRAAMQWDDSANAGFSSVANLSVPICDDYKQVNFKEQYGNTTSALKMFIKLAKLRQRDEALLLGKFVLGELHADSFAFSRAQWNDTKVSGKLYLGFVNYGAKDKSINMVKENLFPETWKKVKAEVVAVTPNVHKFYPRQIVEIDLSVPFNITAMQGIVIRI